MSTHTSDNVGVVTPSVFHYPEPFVLQNGGALEGFDLVYETYGNLNATASNAVLICHALSGHHHAVQPRFQGRWSLWRFRIDFQKYWQTYQPLQLCLAHQSDQILGVSPQGLQ